MNFSERFERVFRAVLPAPFTIAVVLTLLTILLALVFTQPPSDQHHFLQVLEYWQQGLWSAPLLVFAVQMMLILVLGHVLALSPAASRLIDRLTNQMDSPAKAAWLVTLATLLVAFFNWGIGLIFGAIIARKTGERFAMQGKALNYPLIGAAGYSGLMVWHGGISGSAPVKVVEQGHITTLMQGVLPDEQLSSLPNRIPFNETVFSPMNLTVSALLLIILPLLMAWLMKRSKPGKIELKVKTVKTEIRTEKLSGAERLDHSRIFCLFFALLILGYGFLIPFQPDSFSFNFLTPNYINLILLGLALLFHGSFARFLAAVDEAIGGASGILIQFPLYFGIMGIMKYSGLVSEISTFFISISTPATFPIFTFMSAGLVNIFVPSGGGQWSIQGPILIQAAQQLGVPEPKCIMAMAYGDQLTNMLQPFWALPLLGITGLKAREIIPYTLFLLLAGLVLFVGILLIF
ncbi:MAG: TIGR00366 family protein [Owenweeksia sp.]